MLDAGDEPPDRSRVAEVLHCPRPLLLQELRQEGDPDVTVVQVAEELLHLADRFDPRVEVLAVQRAEDLHGVAEVFGGDPHGVQRFDRIRLLDVGLVGEHLLQPLGEGRAGPVADARDMGVDVPELRVGLDRPEHVPDLAENGAAFQPIQGVDHVGLEGVALLAKTQQEALDPRAQFSILDVPQEIRHELDLHVRVAGLAERLGHPADSLAPGSGLLGRQAVLEELQGRPQPPRGHPHVVYGLHVAVLADAGHLVGHDLGPLEDGLRGKAAFGTFETCHGEGTWFAYGRSFWSAG